MIIMDQARRFTRGVMALSRGSITIAAPTHDSEMMIARAAASRHSVFRLMTTAVFSAIAGMPREQAKEMSENSLIQRAGASP